MLSTLSDAWPLVLSMVFSLVWLIRLEAKVLYLERDRADHWLKIDAMQGKLQEIAESLARLEGKLQAKSNDLRD